MRDENCEIRIDLSFLTSLTNVAKKTPQMHPLNFIAQSRHLGDLVLHQVFSPLLYLKWSRTKYAVYISLTAFFLFMIVLGGFFASYLRVLVGCVSNYTNSSSSNAYYKEDSIIKYSGLETESLYIASKIASYVQKRFDKRFMSFSFALSEYI